MPNKLKPMILGIIFIIELFVAVCIPICKDDRAQKGTVQLS